MTTYVVLDFETWPIRQRPNYPPKPVGMAVWVPGDAPFYLSWGHMAGRNNLDPGAPGAGHAREILRRMWANPDVEFICHNAKFDMGVAQEAWGLSPLPWHRVHDTMFLAFLADPHAKSGALKSLADEWLGMPPEEQDHVHAWILAHKGELEARWSAELGGLKVTKKAAGAWIFAAPAELVEPYAIGDVVRTGLLFPRLLDIIDRNGMGEAYDRERRLLPILMRNEREGICVDLELLETDIERYGHAFNFVEDELRRHLRASGLNLDSDQDVAAILIQRGIVPESSFSLTTGGGYAMNKDKMRPDMFTGPQGAAVASALGYRNRLKTCLDMFMRPWQAQASQMGGRITTNWNQTRGYAGGGTRTGRPSTNEHNFLNISKSFEGRDDLYQHPVFLSVPALPLCRDYVLPDPGEVFIHRDFNGQELRVFGHLEQGDLWRQYKADPHIDVHAFIGAEFMAAANREIERTKIKVMNFQSIYGGGAPALADKLRISNAEAKELKVFHNAALPGRVILNDEIKRVVRRGDPVRTWGGRLYFPEPPDADGRSKEYKLLNYLVQGSAADLTKQAIIEWDELNAELPPWVAPARFLVTVYDELDISALPEFARGHMALLRHVMEKPRLTVQMVSDGKMGPRWGKLEKYADD